MKNKVAKPFFSFIKMQLNINYSISALKYRFTREKKKRWEPVLIGAAIIVSLLPLLAMYTAFILSAFAGGMLMGQPEIVLTMAFVFAACHTDFRHILYNGHILFLKGHYEPCPSSAQAV